MEAESSLPFLQNSDPVPYPEQYEFIQFRHTLFPAHAYVFHAVSYFKVSYPEFCQHSPVCVL
jgi:hypothetical protein